MEYYILSTVVFGVIGPDTFKYVRRLSWNSEEGTRLAMPKTDLGARYLVTEARFRGY